MLTAEPHSQTKIRKSTGWLIALSIVLIVAGILAIALPAIASAFFTSVIGWIALLSGIAMVVGSFVSHSIRGFWLTLVVGLLYSLTGIYILSNLEAALFALTLGFGTLFIIEGIYTIIMAFVHKAGHRMSSMMVINGVITLILGIMVLNGFPYSALWLIGLYAGISLLFSGSSLLAAALAVRRATLAS